MIAAPARSYTALECEREARNALCCARAVKLRGHNPEGVRSYVRAARYWWTCAKECRRNCWCNGTGRMVADYDQHTGYNVTVDCPDCTAPTPNDAPAPLVDDDTPAGHLRNALQILTLGRELEPYSPMAGDMVAAVSERIHSALKGLER